MGHKGLQSALLYIQCVSEPEKKRARRDGIVKQKIPLVKLRLWSSRRAGEPLHVAAHCLMASRTAEAKCFS